MFNFVRNLRFRGPTTYSSSYKRSMLQVKSTFIALTLRGKTWAITWYTR